MPQMRPINSVDNKKDTSKGVYFCVLARRTGLEPATLGVTGRYSNQLSYHRVLNWWVMTESNRRHPACKAGALPTELITLKTSTAASLRYFLARRTGLEPATLGVTGRYSNQLSYHRVFKLVGDDGVEPPTSCL